MASKWGPAVTKSARASLVLNYSPTYYGTFKSPEESNKANDHFDPSNSARSADTMSGTAARLTEQINTLKSEVEALKAQMAAAKK